MAGAVGVLPGKSSHGNSSGSTSVRGSSVALSEWIFSLGSVGGVTLDVFAEVVGTHETFVAHRAGKPLLAGVRTEMAGKFVRTGKPFEAALPATGVGTFAGVSTNVRLQVRALSVGFAARFPRADVRSPLSVFASAWHTVQGTVGAYRCLGHFLRAAFIVLWLHRGWRERRPRYWWPPNSRR